MSLPPLYCAYGQATCPACLLPVCLPACECLQTFRIYVLFDPKLRERLGPYVKPSAYRRYMVGLWAATLVVWSLINDWGATRHFKFCISRYRGQTRG